MGRTLPALLLALCITTPSAARGGAYVNLDALLVPAWRVPGGWEAVDERSPDPSGDPDLRAWGVRRQRVRHYSRKGEAGVEVCSVELWAFASVEQAERAQGHLRYPDWQFERHGAVVLMLHAVRWTPDGERRGVFPECAAIGERIGSRAAARVRP